VTGFAGLSLNQATVNKLSVTEAVDLCVRHDIPAIGLWREHVARAGLTASAAHVKAAGITVSSLCRGGFFTHADPVARAAAIADSKAAMESEVRRIQTRVRAYVVPLPALPVLLLGAVVFAVRLGRENRGANPNRLA